MTSFSIRLALALGVLAVAGCSVPSSPVNLGGPLQVSPLAITTIDAPNPPNVAYKVNLSWQTALGAKTYQVLRQFGSASSTLVASPSDPKYTDTNVGAGQAFTYIVRALDGNGKELTVSAPTAVSVLPQQVAKPTGLQPADNAKFGLTDTPTFSWTAVPNANWYYVNVSNGQSHQTVYGAVTKDPSIKFGAPSPLKFDAQGDLFQVGSQSSLSPGIVYYWTVKAIRGDVGDDPNKAKAIDANISDQFSFSLN